jgi:hypothetical protein
MAKRVRFPLYRGAERTPDFDCLCIDQEIEDFRRGRECTLGSRT